MKAEPKITSVYTFANGMCMVFDQYGEQMPEFQGRTEEMRPKIQAVYGGPIVAADWERVRQGFQ